MSGAESIRPSPPQKFERNGKSYIGYAIAFRGQSGAEIIFLAPTEDEAAAAFLNHTGRDADRELIYRAALTGASGGSK